MKRTETSTFAQALEAAARSIVMNNKARQAADPATVEVAKDIVARASASKRVQDEVLGEVVERPVTIELAKKDTRPVLDKSAAARSARRRAELADEVRYKLAVTSSVEDVRRRWAAEFGE